MTKKKEKKGTLKVVDLTGEINDDWLKALPAGKEEIKIHEQVVAQLEKEEKAKKKK